MRRLLRLYPAAWRERYGDEFLELLASERRTPGKVLDVLLGALDAHLNTRLGARAPRPAAGSIGGFAMIGGLTFRCAGGPRRSRAETLRVSLLIAGYILAMTALYVALKRVFGPELWVEAIGVSGTPVALVMYAGQDQLRARSWTARAALLLIIVAFSFLGAWIGRAF